MPFVVLQKAVESRNLRDRKRRTDPVLAKKTTLRSSFELFDLSWYPRAATF